MRELRLAVLALALAAVPSALLLTDSTTADRTTEGEARPSQEDRPVGKTLSASLPARDVRGEPIPGLPRYPGSVRVGYSQHRTAGLVLVRARYLTNEKPDAVREFCRDAFRSGRWELANVEYLRDGWHFLAVRERQEAEVDIRPRGGGSEIRVEVSSPFAGAQASRARSGGSKR